MFENLIETAFEFKKRAKEMVLSGLVDLFFFIIYGAVSSAILDVIRARMIDAFNIVQQNQAKVDIGLDIFSSMGNLPGFDVAFNSMIFWLAILIISTYVLYVAFQIVSWSIILKKPKEERWHFAKKFLLINIAWIIAYYALDFMQNARDFILTVQDIEQTGTFLFVGLFFVMFYFAFVSYASLGARPNSKQSKKTSKFRLAFGKNSIFSLIELAAIFFVLNNIIAVLNLISYPASLAFGIPAVMLLLSFSKLHIARTVAKEKI